MLNGAGIKVDKSNEQIQLGPLTDNDITRMSSGAISKSTMIKEKDFSPEKGGLFDTVITGGTSGNRWSHVKLSEPVVNPRLSKLARTGKVVLLPHMGSATIEGRIDMGEKVIVNIKTFMDGHRPPDRVLPSML